jgi:hypothetical protein
MGLTVARAEMKPANILILMYLYGGPEKDLDQRDVDLSQAL